VARITASAAVQFRELLAVRRRLAFRQLKGRTSEAVAALLVPLVAIPIAILVAVGLYKAFTHAPEPWPIEILGAVLTALWGSWILFPMIAGSFSDAFDLTKLIVYPIHRRALVGSMFVGTVFDVTSLLTVPIFVSVMAAWARGPLFPFVLLALVVLWANMVVGYQLIATTLVGLFQSRRFRELLIIGGTMFGLTFWAFHFWSDNIGERFREAFQTGGLSELRPLEALQWTPPGAVARAIEQATMGEFAGAFRWLGYATALVLPPLWVWWRVLVRVTMQGGMLFVWKGRAGKDGGTQKSSAKPKTPQTPFGELVSKELRVWWRAPRLRMQMFQALLMPIVFMFLFMRKGISPGALAFAPAMFLLMVSTMGYSNVLGADGAGIATIIMSPIRREKFLRAKVAAFGSIVAVPFLVAVIVALWAAPGPFTVAGLFLGLCIALIATTVYNHSSVLHPYPVPDDSKRRSARSQGGFMAVVAMVVGAIMIGIISSPIWSFVILAVVTDNAIVALSVSFVGVFYSMLIFYFGTKYTARTFMSREQEIYLALKPRQHD